MKLLNRKSGILLILLGIPGLLFLFLKFFGHNNFDLPYFFPAIDSKGEIMISKGDTVFTKTPGFELIDQNNTLVNSTNHRELKVISFFFSRCGTICPTSNKNLKRIAENFALNKGLHIYSISVDPSFDTPNVLNAFAKKYAGDLSNWSFLTGDKKYIYNLAIKGFKLSVADAKDYDKTIDNIDEAFIHSDKALLIDKNGYVRGIYTATDPLEIDRLMLEIKILLKQ